MAIFCLCLYLKKIVVLCIMIYRKEFLKKGGYVMQTGSFLDNRLLRNVKYSYHKCGIEETYMPDAVREEVEKEYYTSENGNLFYDKEVGWRDNIILQMGVDIKFDLDGKAFVDHINLLQGEGSEIAGVDVFTIVDGEYIKIGTYKNETGKLIKTPELLIDVAYWCDNLVLRINTDCMPVSIKKLDIWGAWDMENTVYPTPSNIEYKNEIFALADLKSIKFDNDDSYFAARYLSDKLKEKNGFFIDINPADGEVVFKTAEVGKKDSYILDVSGGKVVITAPNRLCMLYAVDAFCQLIDGKNVKCCHIEDEAFMEFRGVHFALPPKNQIGFLKNLVEHVFVPMRYNTIYLQIAGAMRYDNYPEINEAWVHANEMYEKGEWPIPAHYGFVSRDTWEKSEVRELCAYFESFGLEVVPEVHSYGHSQYVTMAYPELAEKAPLNDEDENVYLVSKDTRPDTFYYHTLCPLHKDYYKVMFNIIDEVLEAVKPKRFVQMGHDEIYEVGKCPECQKVPRGDLLATEINTLNDYLRKKGLSMMIWSDMFQNMPYSAMSAINKVSKDIIMMDFVWYFHLDTDLEDNLLSHGFKVMMGNMYSSHYPRFEKRAHKEGMIGAEVSTWLDCNDVIYSYNGKIYDFIYSAEGMWNTNYDSSMRLSYNEIVKCFMKNARTYIANLKCDGVESKVGICGDRKNIPYDIRDIVEFDGALKATLTNPECEVEVNKCADIISFVQATNKNAPKIMWEKPFKIGEYVITYEDGTTYIEDILYAANIFKYRSVYGERAKSPLFRHQGYVGAYLANPVCGKTYDGEDYTLGKYSIRNPHPEKKITSVNINHSKNTDAEIIVFEISTTK